MTNDEIIVALRAVAKNYEGKFVATFETNINAMATDAADHIERLCDENNFLKAEIERLQEYYKLYFERERTIKELQENIEHLQNKIVMYEKEFDRLAWDSSPMGGFHDD